MGGQSLRGPARTRSRLRFRHSLARAENKAAYGEPDVFNLAAAYAFGPARNHAFVDGNKRTAIVAAGTFLLLNGYRMTADDGVVYTLTMALAAGEIDEEGAAAFFRDFTVKLEEE
ncbi:type II toxin-antitoxin system death-on-curing family toxin [Chelativorans sp. AA-79]|uniref:type II toxin-antitoxin system death-on-curing family toxin n=1 Tax=Chelativorans sp. AA-79 TaxID=3028735 RepID=UPI0023F79C02|nr:type II toxin-antitoxin system death-on-curing family toxin [Chelativorans sp. AA-79]WEX11944.1 type II toxin-antitoxin system death-on-curing family toxin [Chelativorans sp. AA-79]